jgi:folylpolyglutamate synthase
MAISDSELALQHRGPTRKETQLSEAASYGQLAAANAYFGFIPETTDPVSNSRILLEERALDSYYNIIFSLVLFWRVHGVWPIHLTIVSHAFKRKRLVDAHCTAIGFPLDRVRFIGINPPGIGNDSADSVQLEAGVSDEKVQAMQGVQEVVDHWAEDAHGVGYILAGKRRKRNPWNIDQRLFLNDEERQRSGVKSRLLDGGGEAILDGEIMPWG